MLQFINTGRARPVAQRAMYALALGGAMLTSPMWLESAKAQDFLLEAGQFEGKKITNVEIRYRGAKTVDEARIRNYMEARAGSTYQQSTLDEDIRTLYSSGLVDDVQFFAENVDGGVKVVAEVVSRPLINGLGFAGNTHFKDRTLANQTKLSVGQILSDGQIIQARKNIEKYYQGYGYPDVTVTHRLQATERDGYADLVFVLDEGVKSEVRKIIFEGNNAFTDTVLRKQMNTKQKGWFSWFTKSGRIDSAAMDEDIDSVTDYYQARGYWRAQVGVPKRVPVEDGSVDLVIPVNEGPKYTVNSVGFSALKVFKPEELRPALSLIEGMPYSSKKMRDDIRMIRSYYGSRGYADAAVVPVVREAGGSRVNIAYKVTRGGVYKVGRVNVQGNTKSQDRVIRRELPMRPGEPFNSVDLETTKRRLMNMNYFGNVDVTSGGGGRSGFRDVNILVEEKKTGSVNFGMGFSSVDSILGFVSLEQSNFDIRNPWKFTGGGQRFSMNLRAGSERKDFSISLTEPWFMGKRLTLGGEIFIRDSEFLSDEYEQGNAGASVHIRKTVGRKSYVRARYTLEEVDIEYDLVPTEPGFSPLFFREDGSFIRSALDFTYVYDSRDSNSTPRKGEKLELGVTLAGGILAGDVDTYSFSAKGSKFWNLRRDGILTVRGALNVVDGFGDTDTPPIFEREFLGGSRNLRGFEHRDVGPRDPVTDEVLGGNTSAYLTVEYTIPVFETVRAAVFYDMGFVNEDSWDFGFSDLATDIGIGARLNLPFGPLAVDYGIPLTTPDSESDKGGQFNFYLNYQF